VVDHRGPDRVPGPQKPIEVSVINREAAQVGRFLLLGGVNSLASIGLYAVLQRVLPIPVAYSLAYLAGIALSALLSGRLVFRVTSSRTTRALAFAGYLAVFLTGLGLVWVLQEGIGLAPLVAGFGSVVVTAPLNYLVGRTVFTR
jgi:putative flippase GtrA